MSTRRDFIKSTMACTAVFAVPTINGNVFSDVPAKSDVVVGKGRAADIIPKLFEKLGGVSRFVKKDGRVLIKPNMGFANPPEWATTTSPEVIYTVAKLCLDAGAKRVIVCDNTLRNPELCKEKTGIADALKGLKGAVIFTPTEQQPNFFEEKTCSKATQLTKTEIVRELGKVDALICLPIAKSHAAGGVSLGIKGLMGLVRDRGIMHREMDLHIAIAEQLYYITPSLTIIDASRALLDNGPAGPGKVLELNTFVAGIDPVATDSYGVSLASWFGRKCEGKNVKHLEHAAKFGFGNIEAGKINEIFV
ncbi:MAG TPA: hypothetical protein DCO75_03590 [Fibrobacteres bacterium]|jgi:uncharacterized protein (DUF362 family)|nr:hypothetical protein [Fibrobacterota bacterium]